MARILDPPLLQPCLSEANVSAKCSFAMFGADLGDRSHLYLASTRGIRLHQKHPDRAQRHVPLNGSSGYGTLGMVHTGVVTIGTSQK